MAHEDRMLSQEEIDSLLKRILPKTDEPAAKDEPASAAPIESPAKPREAAPAVKPVSSFKAAEPVKPGETVPLGQPQEPIKMTEFKMKAADNPPSPKPVKPGETVPLGQPQEPIKMTEYKMKPVDTTPSSRPVEAIERKSSPDDTDGLQKTVTDLSEQVGKLTAAMQTITKLEEKVRHLEALIKSTPDSTRNLNGRIDEIAGALETLKDEKSGQNFLEGFKCSHCRSRGLVAMYVKCTDCGKESWLGWWPEKGGK